jgi:hypothetical protein
MTPQAQSADIHTAHADFPDRMARMATGETTGGMAPSTLWSAMADWAVHLGTAPGKQAMLTEKALSAPGIVAARMLEPDTSLPVKDDRHFASELWDTPPFSVLRDSFLLTEDWWQAATTEVRGMSQANEAALSFAVRQALDTVSPTNFPHLNPEVLNRARETNGASVVQGLMNTAADVSAKVAPDPAPPQTPPELSHGKYRIDGKTVSFSDHDLPICAVGTEKDHVAPWTSVYKIHHLTDADITFVLTNGGHNAGIISEPGHRHRHYRMATTPHAGHYLDHEAWRAAPPVQDGSWWQGWGAWLKARSGARVAPPPTGRPDAGYKPLCDAPGDYVFQT